MFKKHSSKRSPNIIFVIFRLILSLTMFALLIGGSYTAYKHFSGLDPLKLDPQQLLKNIITVRNPEQLTAVLSSIKLPSQNKKDLPVNSVDRLSNNQASSENQMRNNQTSNFKYLFRFLLVADIHNNNDNLRKAISQAKSSFSDIKFIIGLGDYTNVGTIDELKKAKNELDLSSLRYFVIAGDHDLWDSRDKKLDADTNFKQVFGPLYQSFTFNNFKFLLLDNSDNYKGISLEQQSWISDQIEKSKTEGSLGILVFIHEPLYHPSSDHSMGKVQKELKQQAEGLIFQLKAAGAKKIFSGDIHYFSEYEEPVTKLSMSTIGAVTIERNPQVPRFAIVTVFEDGSTKIQDIEIK